MTLTSRFPRLLSCVAPILACVLIAPSTKAAPPASGSGASGTSSVRSTPARNRATSTTALTVASAAGDGSSAITLLATVGGQSGAVTGGSVIFTAQGKRIGEVPVANGSASLTTALPVGLSSLAASYKGDGDFLPSKSATIRFYKDEQD